MMDSSSVDILFRLLLVLGLVLLNGFFVAAEYSIVTVRKTRIEQLPKIGSLQNAEGVSLLLARPIVFLTTLLRPLITVINAITNALLRMLGIEPSAGHTLVHSVEELRMLVEQSREAGFLEEEEN